MMVLIHPLLQGGVDGRIDIEDDLGNMPYHQELYDWEWGTEYAKCPIFHDKWKDTHTQGAVWPRGFALFDRYLYYENRLCVPTNLQLAYIRSEHAYHGHVGADRLWYHFEPRVEFANTEEAKMFTDMVGRQCETCQATQRARRLAGPQEPAPVPPPLNVFGLHRFIQIATRNA